MQDIAAIEARNNRLERQARHNARLQASLEALLERLTLPDRTDRAMAHTPFTPDTRAPRALFQGSQRCLPPLNVTNWLHAGLRQHHILCS